MIPFRLSSLSTLALLTALTLPAAAQVPNVVTDIGITGSLVQQVLGDLGQPEVLLPQGGNAHDYQLRPSQARAVADADLLIWIGPGLAPWMQRAVESLGDKAQSMVLLDLPGTRLIPLTAEDGHDHDHDHAHDDGHDHGPIDPHAWLAPENAQNWLNQIAEQLSAHDPEHAATYRDNAASANAAIADSRARIAARLQPLAGHHFAVQHDAYRYFTSSFDLPDALAVALSDATPPSAARLQQIGAEMAAQHVTCAFPEQNHDDRLIRAAAESSDIRIAPPLDPEGSALPAGPALYVQVLEGVGNGIADCLENNQ